MQHGKLLDGAKYVLDGQGTNVGRQRGRIGAHPLVCIDQSLHDVVPGTESLPVVAGTPPRICIHLANDSIHGGMIEVEELLDPISVEEAARAVPGLVPPPCPVVGVAEIAHRLDNGIHGMLQGGEEGAGLAAQAKDRPNCAIDGPVQRLAADDDVHLALAIYGGAPAGDDGNLPLVDPAPPPPVVALLLLSITRLPPTILFTFFPRKHCLTVSNLHLACLVIATGLFRSLLAPLFVGLLPLRGDALFGAPF
jgi:hypothetical protein